MFKNAVQQIEAEIIRLQAAKTALLILEGVETPRRRGRPAKHVVSIGVSPIPKPKKRTLSSEARERIRQAQLKRWSVQKKGATKTSARPKTAVTAKAVKKAVPKTGHTKKSIVVKASKDVRQKSSPSVEKSQ